MATTELIIIVDIDVGIDLRLKILWEIVILIVGTQTERSRF